MILGWKSAIEARSKMARERDEELLRLVKEGVIEYSNDQEFVKLTPHPYTRYKIISRLRNEGKIKTSHEKQRSPLKLIYVGNDGADICETNKS